MPTIFVEDMSSSDSSTLHKGDSNPRDSDWSRLPELRVVPPPPTHPGDYMRPPTLLTSTSMTSSEGNSGGAHAQNLRVQKLRNVLDAMGKQGNGPGGGKCGSGGGGGAGGGGGGGTGGTGGRRGSQLGGTGLIQLSQRRMTRRTLLLSPGSESGNSVGELDGTTGPPGVKLISPRLKHRMSFQFRKKKEKRRFFGQFKKLSKFICILIGLWRKHASRVKDYLDKSVQLVDVGLIDGLMFDLSEFTAEQRSRISGETITTLRKKPAERSEEEIHKVEVALRNYPAIAAYPTDIQNMIATRAWYERYKDRRLILKQGHVSRCFYFILAGSVVVTCTDDARQVSRTLCYLHRGASFGELGIINHELRSASIISEGPVELLVFNDEDYEKIFMSSGLEDTSDPFLKSLSYLHGWPIDKLADNMERAVLCFFKRGTVLVHDSTSSDWIYIIKSGSCSVLKKLKGVKPQQQKRNARKLDKLSPEEHHEYLKQTLEDTDCDFGLTRIQKITRHQKMRELGLGLVLPHLDPIEHVARVNTQRTSTPETEEVTSSNAPRKISVYKSGFVPRIGKSWFSATKSYVQSKKSAPPVSNSRRSSRYPSSVVRRKSLPSVPPVFVTVQNLTRGDAFGITDLVHDNQPSFSLVSNGAECVLIDKSYYWDNAPQGLLQDLLNDVSPYPAEQTMQEGLAVALHWERHRAHVFSTTLRHVRRHKQQIQQSRGSILRS